MSLSRVPHAWDGLVAMDSHPGQTLPEDRPREATPATGDTLQVTKCIVEHHLHQDGYVHVFDL